jgi:hypothetical protein
MRVGGWVRGQSRKVGTWRKPEAIWKAKPEGWHSAQAERQPEGTAGGSARGASGWLAQRLNRRVGQRRKPMVGTTVQPENRSEAQANGWRNGWAGGSIEGASRREVGRLSWKID